MSHLRQLLKDEQWLDEARIKINRAIRHLNLMHTSNDQTGTTYTFVEDDALRLNTFNNASAQTITIPANSSVAFPVGTTLRCLRKGAGLVTFSPAGGVTLNKPTGIRPNRFMGASVKKAANQTGADYTTAAVVAFDDENYDTDAFHDNSTNNSRITIPSSLGIKKVDISGIIVTSNNTANTWSYVELLKNGSASWSGTMRQRIDGPTTGHNVNIATVGSVAAANDYFELNYQTESDASIDINAASTVFQLVVSEIDAQGTIAYQNGFVDLLKTGTDAWTISGSGLG